MKAKDKDIELPQIDAGFYIIDYWQEAGKACYGGMGESPLTSLELEAWANGNGIELTPYEFKTIRALSVDYLSSKRQGEKAICPSPYTESVKKLDRDKVANDVNRIFGGFIREQGLK